MTAPLRGTCLCEAVAFEVDAPPLKAYRGHCAVCGSPVPNRLGSTGAFFALVSNP